MGNHPDIGSDTMQCRLFNCHKLPTSYHLLPTYISRWAVKEINKNGGFAHLSTFAHLFLIEDPRGQNSSIGSPYSEQVGKVGKVVRLSIADGSSA